MTSSGRLTNLGIDIKDEKESILNEIVFTAILSAANLILLVIVSVFMGNQLFDDFESHLSVVDLLFNCGPESLEIISKAKSEPEMI